LIEYPLTKANRLRLARAFRDVPRVDVAIDCVIEGQMGRAFVDHADSPAVFRVQVGPFCYLAGDAEGEAGRAAIHRLPADLLIMPSAPGWVEAIQAARGDGLLLIDRYSFSAESLSARHVERLLAGSPWGEAVRPIDAPRAARLRSDPDPDLFDIGEFDSTRDFLDRGIGFCALDGESVAGVAYSSLACSRGIEVSIFVAEAYRQRGVATALGSALIGQCLEWGIVPHWDAANPESYKLALKLGYTSLGSYECFYLGA
jgi:GNAT superfamily N-acetyltransferase